MKASLLISGVLCILLSEAVEFSHLQGFRKMGHTSHQSSSSCICKYEQTPTGTDLNCNNCLSVSDFNEEIQRLSERYTVSKMNIRNFVLMYLPTTIFKWIKMSQLSIHNSTVMGLEDDKATALEASRETFKYLEMQYVTGVDSWRWSAFSDLGLESIRIQYCEMYSVNWDFGEISKETLAYVTLINNKIEFIDDHAFSSFDKLYSLFIYKNNINKLERTMFPNPANALRILDFGDNKLKSLPKDIFNNMPVLNFINLENNMLRVLNAETYKELLSRKKLHLSFEGNKIICCSSLEWILAAQGSVRIMGTCDRSSRLSGKKFGELRRQDIEDANC